MIKDMNVIIHPKVPLHDWPGELGYACGRWVIRETSSVFGSKDFKDAELAAEVHAADLTCWVRRARCNNYPGEDALWNHYERGIDQLSILERFAVRPHARWSDYA